MYVTHTHTHTHTRTLIPDRMWCCIMTDSFLTSDTFPSKRRRTRACFISTVAWPDWFCISFFKSQDTLASINWCLGWHVIGPWHLNGQLWNWLHSVEHLRMSFIHRFCQGVNSADALSGYVRRVEMVRVRTRPVSLSWHGFVFIWTYFYAWSVSPCRRHELSAGRRGAIRRLRTM